MSQKSAQSLRGQLLTHNDGRGTSSLEILISILIFLAAGKGHNLGCHIGVQLLLAAGALNRDVIGPLTPLKADELQGDNIGPLVQKLIEGMLAVGAGLSEDHGAGRIIHRLAIAVDRLAIGLHVQLLQMGREPGQGL